MSYAATVDALLEDAKQRALLDDITPIVLQEIKEDWAKIIKDNLRIGFHDVSDLYRDEDTLHALEHEALHGTSTEAHPFEIVPCPACGVGLHTYDGVTNWKCYYCGHDDLLDDRPPTPSNA